MLPRLNLSAQEFAFCQHNHEMPALEGIQPSHEIDPPMQRPVPDNLTFCLFMLVFNSDVDDSPGCADDLAAVGV